MSLSIEYGANNNYKNVTDIVVNNCVYENEIFIPSGDNNRALIFGDPLFGVVKDIKITRNGEIKNYTDTENILIDVSGLFYSDKKESLKF